MSFSVDRRHLFDEDRVAKLMCPVTVRVELFACSVQCSVVSESTQQFVVTRPRFMGTREDRVDDAEPAGRINSLVCQAIACTNVTAGNGTVLERAHDGCADGDDASAAGAGAVNGTSGGLGNTVRLVERKVPVQLLISGRRNAGRVRDGGNSSAS